jgi:hypothetical protein
VENQQVREFLERAETLIDEKKYLSSVIAARDAFENARQEKTKLSTLRVHLLPALIESKDDRLNLHYFLMAVGEELEVSRLGVDMHDYRRFKEYTHHIPLEYCADSSAGGAIMQRPWNEEDARFCYDFASSSILLWQSEESERLYPINLPDKHEWEVSIGGVVIPREAERGCTYFRENQEEMEVFFVSRELKDKLVALRPETSTSIVGKVFVNDVQERMYSYSIILLACYARLAINNPERWEVILWWRPTSEIESQIFGETSSLSQSR